jgi:hypothetical protein
MVEPVITADVAVAPECEPDAEVYKFVDYASAIRVNEKFKYVQFTWKR